jgi:hypothetical protein
MTEMPATSNDDGREGGSATAVAYETAEEARLLLQSVTGTTLEVARRDVAEAAYYLSDTIEPDDRAKLLAFACRRQPPAGCEEEGDARGRAAHALALLSDSATEVEALVRGPTASSELLIALRSLRRAISGVAAEIDLPTNHVTLDSLRTQALAMIRETHV